MEIVELGGQWMTYREAAALIGKSVEATRQQASRGRWPTRKNALGVTEVNVPVTPPSDDATPAVTSRAVMPSHRDMSVDASGSMLAVLRSDVSDRDQRIGKLEEQLRASRREVKRLQAHVDTLNAALTALRGIWKEDED